MNFIHAIQFACARLGRGVRSLRVAILTCGGLLLTVTLDQPGGRLLAIDYRAENVYAQPPKLLASLQRVAILPIASVSRAGDLPEGCEAMNPVLLDELVRTKKFEVVSIKPADLRFSSGRPSWTGAEALPANFFETLQRTSGCDAVLFCELTEFRAYTPLAIGWRFKLVDVRTKSIIWAADQVFDDHQPALAQKAGLLKRISAKLTHSDDNAWVEAVSPQVFGHKTISAVLKTLPER